MRLREILYVLSVISYNFTKVMEFTLNTVFNLTVNNSYNDAPCFSALSGLEVNIALY